MKILNDFNTSVEKALTEIDPQWKDYKGLIVCGTHSPKDWESMIDELKTARENDIPTLGICFGMQLMAIEYVRNVVGKEATSEEFGGKEFVVIKMPELRVGLHPALYSEGIQLENFWHNYKVDVDNFPELWDGFQIGEANDVVTNMKLKDHQHYVGVQFHAEYNSSIDKPHELLVNFLNICKSGSVE